MNLGLSHVRSALQSLVLLPCHCSWSCFLHFFPLAFVVSQAQGRHQGCREFLGLGNAC